MGVLQISTRGSFPTSNKEFSAQRSGHAHAVAQAIQHLSSVVLPAAIAKDHELAAQGLAPSEGFGLPKVYR